MRRGSGSAAANSSGLPADLAAGPDPRIWGHGQRQPELEWRAAGEAWSKAHGLGHSGWLELLDPSVRYAVSALGRAHRRKGGLVAPWEKTARPAERTTQAPPSRWAAQNADRPTTNRTR